MIVTLLEMAFGGNCGIDINDPDARFSIRTKYIGHMHPDLSDVFFSEELGLVIEYLPENEDRIIADL